MGLRVWDGSRGRSLGLLGLLGLLGGWSLGSQVLANQNVHSPAIPPVNPPPHSSLSPVAQPFVTPSANAPVSIDQKVACDLLVVGGGLAGAAATYEALLAGRTVCLTEITDWVGGQISAQGTSALDEVPKQREQRFYPRGYNEFRDRITQFYGRQNPGNCWVSHACFLPRDGHSLLWQQLQQAERAGGGKLLWFPNTVIKDLQRSPNPMNGAMMNGAMITGAMITGAIAIQHRAATGAPALNTLPLSHILEDAYRYPNSHRLHKTIIRFSPRLNRPLNRPLNYPQPPSSQPSTPPRWIVIDATETGELVGLADLPHRLGLDPRSARNPSSASTNGDPYCTQGFTYPFALEQTATPQPQTPPPFYPRYQPYYGYDPNPKLANFNTVFTYRRIWTSTNAPTPQPGDISMQNWLWGNDYRPGTAQDNLVYSREQLQRTGQLHPGGWRGGLRPEALKHAEELALGFYYWLVAGTTNSQGPEPKLPYPNHRLLTGLNSPMGTVHGLAKYPYIREGRRIIGRVSSTYPMGFSVDELDISAQDFRDPYYAKTLSPGMLQEMQGILASLEASAALTGAIAPDRLQQQLQRRSRSTAYPDSVGIAQYAIDLHPCMAESPPEKQGNRERPGTRQGQSQTYPAQIPLRALIPQQVDNLLIAGKAMAASHMAAAAYRVHSFEWSIGAAAGTTADLVLQEGLWPYQLVDDLPRREPRLDTLRRRLAAQGNPTEFPLGSLFGALANSPLNLRQ